MTIDAAEITRLRGIAGKATPGPWKGPTGNMGRVPYVIRLESGDEYGSVQVAECGDWKDGELARFNLDRWCADAAHIAAFDPPTVLALIAELEKAWAPLLCGHHHSLEIRSVESDYRACELCETRARQRDAETMESRYRAERDAARALLREVMKPYGWVDEYLRARITKLLRDGLEGARR